MAWARNVNDKDFNVTVIIGIMNRISCIASIIFFCPNQS